MKRALVLSGGAALGAFEFGALKYIHDRRADLVFTIIAGTSVGAVNGVMWAMDKFDDLERFWNTVRARDIYRGSLCPLSVVLRLLTGARGITSNKPLKKLLDRHVAIGPWCEKVQFLVGYTSLVTGEYVKVMARDCASEEDFRRAILSSTSMPLMWKPVPRVRLSGGTCTRQNAEGGLRNVTPLGDVVDLVPDQIIIIGCSPRDLPARTGVGGSVIQIAVRALWEIAFNEIYRNDVNQFLAINRMAAQAAPLVLRKENGSPYIPFTSFLIEPDEDLGSPVDFSRDTIDWRIRKGWEQASRVL